MVSHCRIYIQCDMRCFLFYCILVIRVSIKFLKKKRNTSGQIISCKHATLFGGKTESECILNVIKNPLLLTTVCTHNYCTVSTVG